MASSTRNMSEPDEVVPPAPVVAPKPVAEVKAPAASKEKETVTESVVEASVEVTESIVPVTPPDFPTADQIVIMREGMSV